MSNLEKQSTRLHPETLTRLQSIAEKNETTVSEIIRDAVQQYLSPDNSFAAVAKRIENIESSFNNRLEKLESTIVKLVDVIKERDAKLAAQNAAMDRSADRIRRNYNLSRLMMAWGETLLEKAYGKERLDFWLDQKKSLMATMKEEENNARD